MASSRRLLNIGGEGTMEETSDNPRQEAEVKVEGRENEDLLQLQIIGDDLQKVESAGQDGNNPEIDC